MPAQSITLEALGIARQENPMESQKERLRAEIERVFPNEPIPGKSDIPRQDSVDPMEWDSAVAVFGGKFWKDYLDRPFELLGPRSGYRMNIFFLSPAAFRYFLPLFLIAAFLGPERESLLADSVLQMLTPSRDPSSQAYHQELVKGLTQEQLRTSVQCIEYFNLKYGDDYDEADIKEAVESLKSYLSP